MCLFLFVKTLEPCLFFPPNRMKPRKVKEDDAPRTIACPHKVSFYDTVPPKKLAIRLLLCLLLGLTVLHSGFLYNCEFL